MIVPGLKEREPEFVFDVCVLPPVDVGVPPLDTGRVIVVLVLVTPPRDPGVVFAGNVNPKLCPSSNAVLDERFRDGPKLKISLSLKKSRFAVPLIPRLAYEPGVVERTVNRLSAFAPSIVNSPDTLNILPEVRYSVSRLPTPTNCLKKFTKVLIPIITCDTPFSVVVPFTVPIWKVVPEKVALVLMTPLFDAVPVKLKFVIGVPSPLNTVPFTSPHHPADEISKVDPVCAAPE